LQHRTETGDVRLVFATNRDLENGAGRTFARTFTTASTCFDLPAAIARTQGRHPLLACHSWPGRERSGKDVARFSEDALQLLEAFDWPGNVRQLDATIERRRDRSTARSSSRGTSLARSRTPHFLRSARPENHREFLTLRSGSGSRPSRTSNASSCSTRSNAMVERHHAASEVGIQRPNFQMLMRRHGVKTPTPRGDPDGAAAAICRGGRIRPATASLTLE